MNNLLKNKKMLGGIIAFLVVLLILVGLVFMRINNPSEPTLSTSQDEMTPVEKMNPEDIGLQIVLASDNKHVQFTADKLEGVKKLEWEFSYDSDVPKSADFPDSDGQKITQSFSGEAEITGSTYESPLRELGTCSKNICRFDTGVESINLLVKVTKSDGKVYQINDSLSL